MAATISTLLFGLGTSRLPTYCGEKQMLGEKWAGECPRAEGPPRSPRSSPHRTEEEIRSHGCLVGGLLPALFIKSY